MGLENLALAETGNFPIRHEGEVHNGKVRSVYWLNGEGSRSLCGEYSMQDAPLGVMIISDRISAFDCNWQGEGGLVGVPGKGASLNAISRYWFDRFDDEGLAGNHVVDVLHPLVWLVQKAKPILVEAIGRQYITGSMLRDYKKGVRNFCGVQLPDGLRDNQRLPDLVITPITKGILRGISGVPETGDVNITREQIITNHSAFGFESPEDVELYGGLLRKGFGLISRRLDKIGQIFVDTKFEFGYAADRKLIYIDEVGTPDSSRMWDAGKYRDGKIVENSKEGFRQFLLGELDREVLLDSSRMVERRQLARDYRVPAAQMMEVSAVYREMAERITGVAVPEIEDAREEILDVLKIYELLE